MIESKHNLLIKVNENTFSIYCRLGHKSKFESEARSEKKVQGRVVRKPVNVNPGLKVNGGNNFPSMKMLSTAYVLCSLRLFMLKTEGQKKKKNITLLKSYKNEIKILANPGLA